MKLRLKSNTVRFRTTRSEVATLISTGRLEEVIQFNEEVTGALAFVVALESESVSVGIRYAPSIITLVVPESEARDWANSDTVGIYATVKSAAGPLDLILEKDFACLDRSDAENLDTFPHPQAEGVC
jgi:hypothetical protein